MAEQNAVTLRLTLQQVNVVLSSLGKQPFELVAETFMAVREQTARQVSGEAAFAPPNGHAADQRE